MAGIVGTISNYRCQFGAVMSLAIDVSIETSIEQTDGGFTQFKRGRAMLYWQIAAVTVEGLAVLMLYRTGMRSLLDERRSSDGTLGQCEECAPTTTSQKPGEDSQEPNTADAPPTTTFGLTTLQWLNTSRCVGILFCILDNLWG